MKPEATLTKTVTVLHGHGHGVFTSPVEEPGDRYHVLTVDPVVWDEMGQPDTITVTIEPGDRLNNEGASI